MIERRVFAATLAMMSLTAMPALAASPATAIAAAPPQIGAFGFDVAGMDKNIAPGDDFYGFANGTWEKNTVIPADKANYGMFSVLDDLSRERMRAILEETRADPNSKIGNAYASYLDLAGVEARGLAPIAPWLAQVRRMSSEDYPALVARAVRDGIGVPFIFYVSQDDKAPDEYILSIYQAGLGMPDRDYYLADSEKMREVRAAYRRHLSRMLELAGDRDTNARADALMRFEMEIARLHWTRTESRDADKTYNKQSMDELEKSAPGFGFREIFSSLGLQPEAILVAQPDAISGIAKLIGKTPVTVLRDALLVRSLDAYADVLPERIALEQFDFHGRVLLGTPEREPRWKRGVNFVKENMGDELGKAYVARHFPPETKAMMDELVANVIAAMGRRIDALEWMTPETRAKAHAKLASFTTKIGYPDRWRDYAGLRMDRTDLFGNAVRANRFAFDYMAGKLGQSVYRWEWFMTPMEINAYANFGMNEIVFPAAILQPPFFDPHADPAINYGGIGAVIGHEISHHFDDQGSKYDAEGRLNSWWTEQDIANFKARTRKLVDQYNAYAPLPGMHLNGELTLGENIGDLAGLAIAHDAYRHSLGGKEAEVVDGLSGDARFFLGWAQIWRRSYREEDLRKRLLTDPHAPSRERANIVRNFDAWYDAFQPDADSELALEPDERVKIW